MKLDYNAFTKDLISYVVRELLQDERSEVTTTTPLLETHVLNSMNTYKMIGYIQQKYGVSVPPNAIVADNFRNVDAIAQMVMRLGESAHSSEKP